MVLSLHQSTSKKRRTQEPTIMKARKLSEKINRVGCQIRSNSGGLSIIFCQHILLYTSSYVAAGGIYTIANVAVDLSVLISIVLQIGTAFLTISSIGCHNLTSYLSTRTTTESNDRLRSRLRWLSNMLIRLVLLAWLVVCGLIIIFTVARHSTCKTRAPSDNHRIDRGSVCYIERSCVGGSLLALFVTISLFVLICRIPEPHRYHLFGMVKQPATLPFLLPYKTSSNQPNFSEMSFKCRSSASLSSKTLVHSFSDSRTTLLPTEPARDGLGIYAPVSRAPSFLAPRPSLSSIRSYTEAIPTQPPSSPLPPLPVYRSEKYRRGDSIHTEKSVLTRPARYRGLRRQRTLWLVPPSPKMPISNLAAFNQSQISLSSVYSQDPSGRRHSTGLDASAAALASNSCTWRPDNDAITIKSPKNVTRLVDCAGFFPTRVARSMQATEHFDTDIDDAISLQAKLPVVRAVSTFGAVHDWRCGSEARAHYYQRLIQRQDSGCRRTLSFRPLLMRKTRNSNIGLV